MGGKICWTFPGELASLLRYTRRCWSFSCLQAAAATLWWWGKSALGATATNTRRKSLTRKKNPYHSWIFSSDYTSSAPLSGSLVKRDNTFSYTLNHWIRFITIWNQSYLNEMAFSVNWCTEDPAHGVRAGRGRREARWQKPVEWPSLELDTAVTVETTAWGREGVWLEPKFSLLSSFHFCILS